MGEKAPPPPVALFGLGGMSSMCAACCTNPIDVIKVRMQLEGELQSATQATERHYKNFVSGMSRIVAEEGVLALYKGLPASLMREGIYSTIRLGGYEPFKDLFGVTDNSHSQVVRKILAAACAGAIGSAIANPTDLVKIRMQAEGKLAPGAAPRYASTLTAFFDIHKHEGFKGLYRGTGPTVQRAALLTATQLPTYDHSKHMLLDLAGLSEGLPLHVSCSMLAGLAAALVTSPFDVVKTRVMNQAVEGRLGTKYGSTLDCFAKCLRAEGLGGLYKGFLANWFRIGPHTVVTFLVFERLRSLCGFKPV
eukprot:gnl/Hemi2/24400_TR8202_c0_g1_i1.p1 gnl/Hemi2/24400_TR8202_c0_g1~~gnl/Hemi2/24400_TR8202_c0_g1_i1.p1  ORF type:complete len:307 (+),score=75.80 gnl/Hemi2/24400_TR8202_c0_g1_i1:61-981(+)